MTLSRAGAKNRQWIASTRTIRFRWEGYRLTGPRLLPIASAEILAALACYAPSVRFSLARAIECLPILRRASAQLADTLLA
ncbi:hypothetical protein [Dongia sp.]|uniref:hypothetical protein n=1 Tax=Dongia sp. TaxID=1977262 RepID=UPI0035B05FF5